MSILAELKRNKGTVSSALGKELAKVVLAGKKEVLQEAILLTSFDSGNMKSKGIRAGAAKIVEKVAEEKPELVARHLGKLLPALDMPEPQTRWMVMMTLGYCASLNPQISCKAVPYAKQYLKASEGVCLSGATALYLGAVGALSAKDTKRVLPILIAALRTASVNEVDWIVEAFIKIADHLKPADRNAIVTHANKYLDAPKQSTRKRVEKLMKKIG
jgi:hypothetical protein